MYQLRSIDPRRRRRRTLVQFIEIRKRIVPRLRPWVIHRPMQWFLDGLCGVIAILLAYLFRFDFAIPQTEWPNVLACAAVLFIATPIAFSVAGGYRATWQFFGHRDLLYLALRAMPISVVMILLRTFAPAHGFVPYSVAIMDYGLLLGLTGSVRMLRRLEHELLLRQSGRERVLIVGTPSTLLGAIRQLQPLYSEGLVGIVIDDDSLHQMRVAGIAVLGQCGDLRQIVARQPVDLLFLTSADFPSMAEIIRVASEFGIAVKLLPSPQDLIDNRVRVSRTLTVDSLHERNGHIPNNRLSPVVVQCLTGRTVLVTGAGGSIGSEIARQVSGLDLKKLIVLDNNENSIFELLNELGRRPSLMPVIADIRDSDAVRNLFASERPDVILHAAAYKHVPMMELNPCESVLNNVKGTCVLVDAAVEFYAERLVMISSDKAVHPSSVMGATKRVAEIVVQKQAGLFDDSKPRTHFACVRFGNVLGSRGSVLPIFLRQIASGGPVTVTHEDMTRYFMTIPQAVRLVLEAATLASAGDVYMLDMGDPVRIMDFARDVIELSGLTLGRDIHIEVVGTRPGEKLHEQLWSEDAHVVPTEFAHVFRVRAQKVDPSFPSLLASLIEAAQERRPDDVLSLLHSLPIHFLIEQSNPIAAVLTRV